MTTINRFIWFTYHSWKYNKGQRMYFFKHFITAWRYFNWACKKDVQ